MKQSVFVILIILLFAALPLLCRGSASVVGRIRIPSADVSADVFAETSAFCDCGGTMWHGGQGRTLSDLSAVDIDDRAYLTLLTGQRFVVECIEITPCIRMGNWLLGWRGTIRANGDVLIVSGGYVYRWTIL